MLNIDTLSKDKKVLETSDLLEAGRRREGAWLVESCGLRRSEGADESTGRARTQLPCGVPMLAQDPWGAPAAPAQTLIGRLY